MEEEAKYSENGEIYSGMRLPFYSTCDEVQEPAELLGCRSYLSSDRRNNIVDSYEPRENIFDLLPSSTDEIMGLGYPDKRQYIFKKCGYVLLYNPERTVANIACELLTDVQMVNRYLSRKNSVSYYPDTDIDFATRATEADYSSPVYEKGHLAAAANHAYNFKAYSNTFCLSNIVPMHKNVNTILKKMEQEARSLLKRNEKVYIFTGTVFDQTRCTFVNNESKVQVPESIFKVIVHDSGKKDLFNYVKRAYEIPNSNTESERNDIIKYKTTVEEINLKTGLNILSKLKPEEVRDQLQNTPRQGRRSRNIGI